jgi:hypothetical protein
MCAQLRLVSIPLLVSGCSQHTSLLEEVEVRQAWVVGIHFAYEWLNIRVDRSRTVLQDDVWEDTGLEGSPRGAPRCWR